MIGGFNLFWNKWDYQAVDSFYSYLVKSGKGPEPSSRIVYLDITDETYRKSGKNTLDRKILAQVNDALSQLSPEAVFYDIIFSRPSQPETDIKFSESIKSLGKVYLPAAFLLSDQPKTFKWEEDQGHNLLRKIIQKVPTENGISRPLYATRSLMSLNEILSSTSHTGHINVIQDPDGTYRHYPLLVKLDSGFIPSIPLAIFLEFNGLSMNDVSIDWGKEIRITATSGDYLNEDLIVPINNRGFTFIPNVREWGKDFQRITFQEFLKYFEDMNFRGNLEQLFEGSFVIISDVSQGVSDIGKTSLEENAPLVTIHASILNSLLIQQFYSEWTFSKTILFVFTLNALLIFSALFKRTNILYLAGILVSGFILSWGWYQIENNVLFPVVSATGGIAFVFSGLVISIQAITAKERAFIKDAFSRYVPQKVVSQILEKPELLKLGGEERVMTALFSDIAGFTTISEKMKPTELVGLLNEYLTEMTGIVLEEGGIIDKFEGDAVMAEFGAPLPTEDHADRAVMAGLKMQRRLTELRKGWASRGLPTIEARIGINTGSMVIGNMGSNQVFDYTVMGDSVNLASRLEGANKPYGTYLMISEFTLTHLTPGLFRVRIIDVIKVKGKSKAVKVYEVYGESSEEIPENELKYYNFYRKGFEAYLEKDFHTSIHNFNEALALRPKDLAANEMIRRINCIDKEKIPPGWDGSVALQSK
ncbi:hypothetical protein UR09_04865 [Candidatus Nitromaritima sp. SCGC AAA799-A02]|nr:hypothetical protein UR09_04865 [Candidatus Nitromaritima sp. SCGC AAA799-A02]